MKGGRKWAKRPHGYICHTGLIWTTALWWIEFVPNWDLDRSEPKTSALPVSVCEWNTVDETTLGDLHPRHKLSCREILTLERVFPGIPIPALACLKTRSQVPSCPRIRNQELVSLETQSLGFFCPGILNQGSVCPRTLIPAIVCPKIPILGPFCPKTRTLGLVCPRTRTLGLAFRGTLSLGLVCVVPGTLIQGWYHEKMCCQIDDPRHDWRENWKRVRNAPTNPLRNWTSQNLKVRHGVCTN